MLESAQVRINMQTRTEAGSGSVVPSLNVSREEEVGGFCFSLI